VGDKILFGKYSGSDIKLDGEEALIMRGTKSSDFDQRAVKCGLLRSGKTIWQNRLYVPVGFPAGDSARCKPARRYREGDTWPEGPQWFWKKFGGRRSPKTVTNAAKSS
jgi:hypothetical protein